MKSKLSKSMAICLMFVAIACLFVTSLLYSPSKDEEDKKTVKTIRNVEGKDYLIYEWIDIDEIDKYPLRPKVIKDMLKNKVFPAYKYNNDLKKTE